MRSPLRALLAGGVAVIVLLVTLAASVLVSRAAECREWQGRQRRMHAIEAVVNRPVVLDRQQIERVIGRPPAACAASEPTQGERDDAAHLLGDGTLGAAEERDFVLFGSR